MDSMRAVGYSLRTALADIVDNSLAARARAIEILFESGPTPYIAVLDDGEGMDARAAREAMQLAGRSSLSDRDSSDLGRFGLGLKTASLSQCRQLTVVSKQSSTLVGLEWDLDHIAQANEWSLNVLDLDEIEVVPGFARLAEQESGTLVVWRRLDRLLEAGGDSADHLDAAMVDARDHLSLVFHRFLSGDDAPRVALSVNEVSIDPVDPFLTKSRRTQASRKEDIAYQGAAIEVRAFTLPFINKMTRRERELAAVAGALRDSQGFYIYRGARLVIWGTWFRLMPKSESGKLTRVRVDIPNSLDHLWSLDIKKSSAVPPAAVRARLRELATTMAEPGRKAISFRGRKAAEEDAVIRPWELVLDRDSFRYGINRNHPMLGGFVDGLEPYQVAQFDAVLRVLEGTFPVQDLHNRMSNDQVSSQATEDLAELRAALQSMWASTAVRRETVEGFVERMVGHEPFDLLRGEQQSLISALQEQEAERATAR